MIKNKHRLTHSILTVFSMLFLFSCLLFYGLAPAQAADSPHVQRPTAPVAPQPPTRPSMDKSENREKTPPKQEPPRQPLPAKSIDHPTQEAAQSPKSAAPNKVDGDSGAAVKHSTPEQATQGDWGNALPKNADESTDKAMGSNAKAPTQSGVDKAKAGSSGWVKNFFYALLLLCAAGSGVYCYRQNSVQHRPVKSTKKTAKAAYKPDLPLAPQAKIKNTSLLEQLIQFDMETYGELRAGLDYEQPYYVEQLIKKYGRGDQVKIKRAIHLFYMNRNKT